MNKLILLTTIALIIFVLPGTGSAAGDLTSQSPNTVKVTLGTPDGKLVFSPNKLNLETGKLY